MAAAVKTSSTILVVDDDEDMLVMMQHKLIREGYEPIFSPNGKNIMAIITQRHPDLVLLDIQMQGVDGARICQQIKSNPATSYIPVVMFSANDNIETIMKECGADACLTKPFEPGKLEIVVSRLLEPGRKSKNMNETIDKLVRELNDLDSELVNVNGGLLKPSQCYRFESDPVHILFNTNCPDALKQKVEAILLKHLTHYEGGVSPLK